MGDPDHLTGEHFPPPPANHNGSGSGDHEPIGSVGENFDEL